MIQVSKRALHELIEALPEKELSTAQRVLELLSERGTDALYRECLPWGHEPNAETIEAIEQSQAGVGVQRYATLDEMWRDLGR